MIPMEPVPPMHPFAIVVIFFREMGGCWLGPWLWNDEVHNPSHLTPKLTIFRTPQKAALSDPGIVFYWIVVDFELLFDVLWRLIFSKTQKRALECFNEKILNSFNKIIIIKVRVQNTPARA